MATSGHPALRAIVIEAVRRTPAYEIADPEAIAALDDPAADPSFESLGIDSLGRMEFCIALSEDHGFDLAADDLVEHPTVEALVRHLARLDPTGERSRAAGADDAVDLVAQGLASIRSAQGSAELYRTLRDLEGNVLPTEAAVLLDEVRRATDLPGSVGAWADRFRERLFTEDPVPRRFDRTVVSPEAVLHRTLDHVDGRPGLAVLLGGNSRRLFLPAAIVLQHFPRGYDVLLLLRGDRATGSQGIVGIADDLAGVSRWLRADMVPDHSDVVVLGASAGGRPALEVGARIGARRAVSMGGSPPTGPGVGTFLGGPAGTGTDEPTVPDCERWCVYNAEYERDRDGALALRALLPGAVALALTGAASHNVLKPASERGGLVDLLELLVRGHLDGPQDADGAFVRAHPAPRDGSRRTSGSGSTRASRGSIRRRVRAVVAALGRRPVD